MKNTAHNHAFLQKNFDTSAPWYRGVLEEYGLYGLYERNTTERWDKAIALLSFLEERSRYTEDDVIMAAMEIADFDIDEIQRLIDIHAGYYASIMDHFNDLFDDGHFGDADESLLYLIDLSKVEKYMRESYKYVYWGGCYHAFYRHDI